MTTKTFKLPDLGEGLPDAEIVSWYVEEGSEIELDQPLVSMETAKAVVDVPSPYTGKLVKR
ncbi:MAG: 2-oxo acid dehydrogenase subunit E2, partial [Xanthomonadales bacterium]|nr:2-oxo acid dehydrogenase subunit E2 [Xanthomonadales bacterium]